MIRLDIMEVFIPKDAMNLDMVLKPKVIKKLALYMMI